MDKRERVMNGLECCIKAIDDCECTDNCPYESQCWYGTDGTIYLDLMRDALELLKAQEPRVLTLEEVEALPYGHVIIETDKNDPIRWLDALLFIKNTNFSFDFITLEGKARLLGTEYNREWRCWTAWPTEEQRKAVKWDE